MRLSLVPYLECPTRKNHALLGIACYSEPYLGQKPYSGRCTPPPLQFEQISPSKKDHDTSLQKQQ